MVREKYIPDRGDIVWVSLNPQRGREQVGRRPALVISPKLYNRKSQLALMYPITSQIKRYPFEVHIDTNEVRGVILADQVRTLDWRMRDIIFIGRASTDIVTEVQQKLLALIGGEMNL